MGIFDYYKRNTVLYPTALPFDKPLPSDYYTTNKYSLINNTTTYVGSGVQLVDFPAELVIPIQKRAETILDVHVLSETYDFYYYDLTYSFAGTIIDSLENDNGAYFLIKYQLTNNQFSQIQQSLDRANFYNDRWRSLPTIQIKTGYSPHDGLYNVYDLPSNLPSVIDLNTKCFNQTEKSIYIVRKFFIASPLADVWSQTKSTFSLLYHLVKNGIITIPSDAESIKRYLYPYRNNTQLAGESRLFPQDYITNYDHSILYGGYPLSNQITISTNINGETVNLTSTRKCRKNIYKRLLIKLPSGLANRFKLDEWLESGYLCLHILPEEYSEIEEGEKSKYINTYSNYRLGTRVGRIGFSINSPDLNNNNIISLIKYLAKISFSTGYKEHSPITIIDFCKPEPEDVESALRNNSEPFTTRNGIITVNSASGTIQLGEFNYNQGLQFTFMETQLRLLS